MKKIVLIAIVFGFSFTCFAHPINDNNDNNNNNCALEKKLSEKLKLPERLKKKSNNGIVKVAFMINDHNEIEVKNVSGSTEEIQAYIKGQFKKLGSEICSLEKNITYYIDINIQIL